MLVAYVTFYDRQGRAVAWIADESIYAYSGVHLGWFVDGWIRDLHGHAVFFTPDCGGGPARPARNARPARGARHARPFRPARTTSWSPLSGDAFFL